MSAPAGADPAPVYPYQPGGEALCCVVANGKELPTPESCPVPCCRCPQAGRAGPQCESPGHQCDPWACVPHPLGPGLAGGGCAGSLSACPFPPSSRSTGITGGCTSWRWNSPGSPGGDGAGPVLRHRHHLPVPGPQPGGSSGGGGPPGRRGRQGQRPAQRCHQRRNSSAGTRGGEPAWPAGRASPRSSAWTRPAKEARPEVPAVLSSMAPDRIVVSCDPATLARDVKRLEELGSSVHRFQTDIDSNLADNKDNIIIFFAFNAMFSGKHSIRKQKIDCCDKLQVVQF